MFSLERAVTVIRVLWDLKARVRNVDLDQRTAMEMAFVLISASLSDARKGARPKAAEEPMDIDQLRTALNGRTRT